MSRHFTATATLTLMFVMFCQSTQATSGYGETFDTGLSMSSHSTAAPDELSWAAFMIGQWEVTVSDHRSGQQAEYTAVADIRWMNRGHGLLEEFHAPATDAKSSEPGTGEYDTLSMLGYVSSAAEWNLGLVDSLAEDVTVYNGHILSDRMVLTQSERQGGTITMTRFQLIIAKDEDTGFSIRLTSSVDDGMHWSPVYTRQYRPRNNADSPFTHDPKHLYGLPASTRAEESAQFDFLIGEWDSSHDIVVAPGQNAQFPVNSTAVYTMNGHAILEYSWYDVDSSFPEAATTIVRIYNRAMRHWESLYVNNRANSMLHFGGRKEGEDIVLHNFDIDARAATIPNYVFHDIEKDQYRWLGRNSTDRGASWTTFWTIEFTRKP